MSDPATADPKKAADDGWVTVAINGRPVGDQSPPSSAEVGPQRLPPQPLTLRGTNTTIGQIKPDLVELGKTWEQRESQDPVKKWAQTPLIDTGFPAVNTFTSPVGIASLLAPAVGVARAGMIAGPLAAAQTALAEASPVVRYVVAEKLLHKIAPGWENVALIALFPGGKPKLGAAATAEGEAATRAVRPPPLRTSGAFAEPQAVAVQPPPLRTSGAFAEPPAAGTVPAPPLRTSGAFAEPPAAVPQAVSPPPLRTSGAFAEPQAPAPRPVPPPPLRTSGAFAEPEAGAVPNTVREVIEASSPEATTARVVQTPKTTPPRATPTRTPATAAPSLVKKEAAFVERLVNEAGATPADAIQQVMNMRAKGISIEDGVKALDKLLSSASFAKLK